MKQWMLDGALVGLDDAGTLRNVTADEIYSAVVEESPKWSDLQPGKHGPIANLEFSRYPASLRGVLADSKGGGLPFLSLEIETQDSQRFAVTADILKHDHVVADGTWYPLDPNSISEVQELMQRAGVSQENFRPATLRGLLEIKTVASTDGPVRDGTTSGGLSASALVANDDATPVGLNAKLYPYQSDGWKWLRFIIRENLGGLLADEMGLGKTLQIIAALRDCGDGQIYGPTLVVAPGSLLENWMREI